MATATTMAVTTAVIDHNRAARLLFGGVGLLLVFTACSSDNASPTAGSAVSDASTTIGSDVVVPTVAVDTGADRKSVV